MQAQQLLQTLQLNDSFFPTGSFSFSDGLESAVEQKWVEDRSGLEVWMEHYLHVNFAQCEGLAFHQTSVAYQKNDWNKVQSLDQELTAIKPSASTRMSSQTIGKRFLKSSLPLYPHPDLQQLLDDINQELMHGNAAVVYSLVFTILGIPKKEALLSYGYTCLVGIVSAALRLISIGQQEGQMLLSIMLEQLSLVVKAIVETDPETPLVAFNPFLDVQQMRHRYLYSRLFRS